MSYVNCGVYATFEFVRSCSSVVTNFDSNVGLGGSRHYKYTSSQKEKGLVVFELMILLYFPLN